MTEVKNEKKDEITKETKVEVKEEPKHEEKTVEKTPTEEKNGSDLSIRRRYEPMSMFRSVDRFFNDMMRWFDDTFWRPSRFWDFEPLSLSVFDDDEFFRTPLSNITEDDKGYHLTAELPGLEKGDLEITIRDGTLEIKGERKEEHEDKDEKGYKRKEYSSSSYYRTFALPENVNEDSIDATFDKGVLKLDLSKKQLEAKEKKKIEVK